MRRASTAQEAPRKVEEEESLQELPADQATLYRSVAARANYLAQDRPDLMYGAKEVCRFMAKPTVGAWKALKRLGRYLIKVPRRVLMYNWQGRESVLTGYTDSDWAGCNLAGKSTRGGCITIGGHYLRGWSRTQQAITTSSAEAELVAMNKAAAELLGCLSMFTDFGEKDGRSGKVDEVATMFGVLCGDSSAVLAVANRRGLGKLKHIRLGELWIQEKVHSQELTLEKILGDINVADLYTKHLAEAKVEQFCDALNCVRREGRSGIGLRVQRGEKGGEAVAL